MIDNRIDINFYLNMEGCIVLKDDFNNSFIGYRYSDTYENIDLNGNNLHVVWCEGNVENFLGFASDEVEYISFERNFNGKVKVYSFERLKKLMRIIL